MLLKIKNLNIKIKNKKILKNINLNIEKGTIHAIMGPNGSGKSTLGHTLAGNKKYIPDENSSIILNNKNIIKLNATERAKKGIFLSFQNPLEIPGITNTYFFKTSIDSIKKSQNKNIISTTKFLKKIEKYSKDIGINKKIMKRDFNVGFSGGEKKRNEILQMMLLQPKLCILDETDSGLDTDALKILSDTINKMKNKERSFIIITHYQKLLENIKPDFVHILTDGKIIKSGTIKISQDIEKYGYKNIKY